MRQPKGRSSYKSQSQSELDRFLEGKNLWRKHIAKDGSCLFRAVAEQVRHCAVFYSTIIAPKHPAGIPIPSRPLARAQGVC